MNHVVKFVKIKDLELNPERCVLNAINHSGEVLDFNVMFGVVKDKCKVEITYSPHTAIEDSNIYVNNFKKISVTNGFNKYKTEYKGVIISLLTVRKISQNDTVCVRLASSPDKHEEYNAILVNNPHHYL